MDPEITRPSKYSLLIGGEFSASWRVEAGGQGPLNTEVRCLVNPLEVTETAQGC